jgi:hypothetical protein
MPITRTFTQTVSFRLRPWPVSLRDATGTSQLN